MKRAVLWAAVSSAEQAAGDKTSLPDQLAEGRSAAEREEARQWFDRAWRVALEQLEYRVNAGSP